MEDMGVDYTAFVCWGQRVKFTRDLRDALEEHASLLSDNRVGYAEYGARNYGGDGGLILIIDGTYTSIDVKHDPKAKPLPCDRDWNRVDGAMRIQDVVYGLRQRGVN